jgi:hypothetical protein
MPSDAAKPSRTTESPDVFYRMEPEAGRDGTKSFFFNVDEMPWPQSRLADAIKSADEETKEHLAGIFGKTVRSKKLLTSPTLSVTWVTVEAGDHVKPHRHGTNQLTFVLRGSLQYGNKVLEAGMGRFGPNKPYSWKSGPEGADFLEIHDGQPEIYLAN